MRGRIHARVCARPSARVKELTRPAAYLAHFVRQRHTLGLAGRILCRTKCASPVGTLFDAKHFVSQSGRAGTLFAAKHFVAQSTLWHTLCRAKCFAAQSARRNKAGTPTGRPTDREQIRERTRWCSARDASSSASTTTSLLREEDEEDERSEERPSTPAGLRIRD